MMKAFTAALMLCAAAVPTAAGAQQASITQAIAGTRLDINASGEVMRVPDVAVISTGVVTKSATASGAIREAAARMVRVRAALKAAGIEDRDIQTTNVSLNPEYRYVNNQPPQLTGYTASNNVSVRFRDLANSGKVIDALVAEGSNQINGPTLIIDKPEAALDEARAKAIAAGRARADLYARAMGLRVVRIVSIAENGSTYPIAPPAPYMMAERAQAASTKIDPGEQRLQVNLAMVFELQ